MMNDLKKGMKMMRYAYGIKANFVQAGVFLLMGLVFIVSGEQGSHGMLGGAFWICIGMLPSQMVYSLSAANMVQASPLRKKMQTVIPVAASLACTLLIYLAEVLMCGILVRRQPERVEEIGWNLVILAVMQVLVMVYVGCCYKHFVLATLLMAPAMVIWGQGSLDGWVQRLHFGWDITFSTAVLAGAGLIAVGALAEYLLTLLFYRVPIARRAQATPLWKEL